MALKKITNMQPKGSLITRDDLGALAKEYAELNKQMKALDKRKKELADLIKSNTEKFGTKDDTGSYYFESDEYITGKCSAKSFKINQEKAKVKLVELGLWDKVKNVKVVETVDEGLLEHLVSTGEISLDTINSFTDVKETFRVSVTKKEELPEAEQGTLKVARRK